MTTQGKGEAAHHLVVSLNVTGGFLAGVQLEFADGLNCLIGGRGAGKTTALEFLRFGLGLMPDPKANPQRYRAIEALVKANLGNGQLRIELRTKTDMRYTAGRGAHELGDVYKRQLFPSIAIKYSVQMFLVRTKSKRSHRVRPLNWSFSTAFKNAKL